MTMVFRYKKIDRPAPLSPLLSPVIPVTLIGNNQQMDVLALLDSGADLTAIPLAIAKILNLDLSGGKGRGAGHRKGRSRDNKGED